MVGIVHAPLVVLGLTALGLVVAGGAWWRVQRRRGTRPVAAVLRCERGTATLEFALVFPVVLGLTLVLLQTALLMSGQFFAHYAAFAAARSAIVHVPMDGGALGSPRNVIVPAPGEPKFDAMHRAASVALMPVAGELDSGAIDEGDPIDDAAVGAALGYYFTSRGADVPRWVETKVADRLRYAHHATDLTLMRTQGGGDDGEVAFIPLSAGAAHEFGPRDAITVRIEHRFHLSIPYARAVFTDGRDDWGGAYASVPAQYTLTSEGVSPELPEEPSLRRSDRPDDDE